MPASEWIVGYYQIRIKINKECGKDKYYTKIKIWLDVCEGVLLKLSSLLTHPFIFLIIKYYSKNELTFPDLDPNCVFFVCLRSPCSTPRNLLRNYRRVKIIQKFFSCLSPNFNLNYCQTFFPSLWEGEYILSNSHSVTSVSISFATR